MRNSQNDEYLPFNLDKTVTNVVELLKQNGLTVSAAESCTGGLISELITSVAGASSVFELGLCTYSEKIKNEFLGVPEDEIKKYGVVSSQVALSMVKGLKSRSGADICVSVTGIAGPDGGTKETPVGTVYIGFDIMGRQFVELPDLVGLTDKSRRNIRYAAAAFAFETIENALVEAIQSE
ncbi:MAG: CinA family protein [Ruminococcus flavefaciens]|nr:CinA family protein [Ruminococcus flavefaciens]MCM1059486.1 CinA family protein [Eubacterium sp.]